MTFVQKRNALIAALHRAVRRPVLLASQVHPEAEPPFIIYSVLSDYLPDGGLGDMSTEDGEGGNDLVVVRAEQPSATFSFTACSINRCIEQDGKTVNIFGADEALELATLAQGFFLHSGRYELEKAGFVLVEITNTTSRDALELDEMGRRFGFDVRLRYHRTDRLSVAAVEKPNIIGKTRE